MRQIMTKHIYFLRHFQTENNLNHILNGRNLNIPIIEGKPLYCENDVNLIFCSPAVRCRQTINFFSQNVQPSIVYTNLLLERDLGIMEGQTRKQMIKQYPTLFYKNKLIVYATPPQGESLNLFKQRVIKFWDYCNSVNQNTVLICSHNQTLKMLYFIIQNKIITIDSWNSLSFPHGNLIKIQ